MRFDEEKRLIALEDYRVLDSAPEAAFDNLTRVAARIFAAPISLISLIDRDRQWFKSRFGLDEPQTPREYSFCDHAVRADATLVVSDAAVDPRFRDNPLVLGAPHIRFYCGVPLRTPEGHGLGALCIIDREVRAMSARDLAILEALARQVEIELEIRRRLELLSEALGSARARSRSTELTAAMIVHDMRSPLTAITVLASALQPADDASRADVELLLAEASRLRRMLTDILDVSLHETGGFSLRKHVFDLVALATEVARRMSRFEPGRADAVLVDAPPSPLSVDADAEIVTRVLENLIGNALAHAGHAGPVVIALARGGDRRILVEVRDRGPSIPEKDRARIFEALERGEGAAARRGYGLGLTFCRLAVAAHGGAIAALPNADGEGNCLRFDLPAAE